MLERPMGFNQAGMFVRRQIDLGFVPGNDRLRTVPQSRQEHQHLFRRGILRFVQDDEGAVEGAAAPTPNVTLCLRMASRYFFWPTVLAVTPGLRSWVCTRWLVRSMSVSAPSCFTTLRAWVNSRLRTGEPALSELSSDTNNCLAR